MTKDETVKRRKLNLNAYDDSVNLLFLDDDSLCAILLRTRTSNLTNLRLSCKRFCKLLKSTTFRKERSEKGCAYVIIELISPFKQCKRDEEESSDREESASENNENVVTQHNHLDRVLQCGDYEFKSYDFRVFVDGVSSHKNKTPKPSHIQQIKLRATMLPRKCGLHYLCDSFGKDLAALSTTLFTDCGRPRVATLKKAAEEANYNLIVCAASF